MAFAARRVGRSSAGRTRLPPTPDRRAPAAPCRPPLPRGDRRTAPPPWPARDRRRFGPTGHVAAGPRAWRDRTRWAAGPRDGLGAAAARLAAGAAPSGTAAEPLQRRRALGPPGTR